MKTYFRVLQSFHSNAKLLLASVFFEGMGAGIFSVLFNLYLNRLGHREDLIGLYQMSLGIALAVFSIPAGLIIDMAGFKKPLLLASALNVLFVLGQSSFRPIGAVIAFSLLSGFSYSIAMVAHSPFLSENSTPRERSHLFSVSYSLTMLTGFLSGILSGYLPGLVSGLFGTSLPGYFIYRFSLYVSVLFFVLAAVPIIFLEEKVRPVGRMSLGELLSFRRIEGGRLFVKLIFPGALVSLGAGLVVPFMNLYLANEVKASVAQIGVVYSVMSLSTGIAVIFVPVVSRRLGQITTMCLMQMLSVPFLVLITLSRSLVLVATFMWIRNALMNFGVPILSNFSMDVVNPSEKVAYSGLSTMVSNMCYAASNVAAGYLMAYVSYALPYYLCAFLYAASAVLYFCFFSKMDRKAPAELVVEREMRL